MSDRTNSQDEIIVVDIRVADITCRVVTIY